MSNPYYNVQDNGIRVPNLPLGPIVDKDGNTTEEEKFFRQALLTLLQNLFGEEGMVPPANTTANINAIVAGTQQNQGASDATSFTCQPGTLIYNTTTDKLMTNILVGGTPTMMNITVTP